ncbi:protein root UVB sensitive 6 [Nymphaea colorata]|nr:protein root UVB sensitive 6 [Nymphaea colorata]
MAPIQTPTRARASAQSLATSQDARMLVRETMRLSANLASANTNLAAPETALLRPEMRIGLVSESRPEARVICSEELDGRRWNYVVEADPSGSFSRSMHAVALQTPKNPFDELISFIRSYVVPEGFPDSVSPSYVPYMKWRALKHFFGGAMGVFTTRSLLHSVGMSGNGAASAAVAVNWVLKDGAGRLGKMLFSRQGKKFDYDLKQLRFAGDLLMELGAGIELATTAVPHLFLPFACAANIAKNVAAVTSTSTRAPIYKAFAKGENIGDVTAKGECVGNIADLLGTGLSIMMSKHNPSLVATFSLLSCGYVLSAYKEVKSVVLHTLNKARFTVAVESFLKTGQVPSLKEGNLMEKIFTPPWHKDRPIVLGSRFKDAFQEPASFLAIEPLFEKERYIVTYNPLKGYVYALLKDQAKPDDILKAAFHAYVLLHFIRASTRKGFSKKLDIDRSERDDALLRSPMPTIGDFGAYVAESCRIVSTSYGMFKKKAAEQGWTMSDSLLNPGRARICSPMF